MISPGIGLNEGDDEPDEDVAKMAGDELVESPDDGGVFLDLRPGLGPGCHQECHLQC